MIGLAIAGTTAAFLLGSYKEVLPIESALPKIKYYSMNDSGYIQIKEKPLMIMYFSPDCSHCEYELDVMNNRFAEITNADAYCITTDKMFIQNNVYKKWNNLVNSGNFVFAQVKESEYKNKYGINVTPVFYFFGRNGRLVDKIVGETKFDRILGSIKRMDGSKHLSGGLN